ncbi:MAG: type ISP restriction/modification enzyme [Planctomycetota bacterium]
MSMADRDRLRRIKTFPSLVKYLRDELDWPIDSDDFDELTFDYEPEELGLDAKAAVKIKQIKQLRPLTDKQQWGIFFINFEPKRLPVVALRRILRSLVIKKRQSANKPQQAAWQLHDLLFISSYGEADHRDITFAHFAEDADHDAGLPALRVLGWDDEDTVLHLVHAHATLKEQLRWPEDDTALDAWRSQWSSAFTLRHREVINTSKALAVRMAQLASAIRKRANRVLTVESEKGPLRKLMTTFKEALIHDLSDDDFADMYAQTITYGLLTARASRPAGLVAGNLADMVPITNPFLKELMESFLNVGGRRNGKGRNGHIDFDELGINDVVDTLREAKMEAILRDFGDRNPEEDPVIHFYERFLKQYDPEKRMKRGVFYTPRPVVSYIIRSVHELLQTEFGLADGLADTTTWGEMLKKHKDLKLPEIEVVNPKTHKLENRPIDPATPFVQILDAAAGTATFLVEVSDIIHKTMVTKWQKQGHTEMYDIPKLWNEYVPKHLLPRLHGYELMMAPYAIAHMKVGLAIKATRFNAWGQLTKQDRARIYLTNALEPPHDFSDTFEQMAPALAHEAQAVSNVKRHQRFTVVIGNPPYSPSISEPNWLMEKLEDWKRGLNETKIDLNREEWKFLRFAQHQCVETGVGTIGYIINRDFLDGIAKRRMREHLAATFLCCTVVDLNGDVKGNIADENVFEIEQGVAIVVLCTARSNLGVRFASRVGTRAQKYADLLSKEPIDTALMQLKPCSPYFRWVPFSEGAAHIASAEYYAWPQVRDVFQTVSSGIQTKRDGLCVAFSKAEMWRRIQEFVGLDDEGARARFDLGPDGRDWTVSGARVDLVGSGPSQKFLSPILYRPFDTRFTYWTGRTKGFLAYPRREVMQHVVNRHNVGMIFNRQIVGESVSHFGVSRIPICHGTFYLGNKGQDYFAPLWLHPQNAFSSDRQSNFTAAFIAAIDASLCSDAAGAVPESVFGYIYAIFHSVSYRTRYAEFLKIDFPRIPLPTSLDLFHDLARLGSEAIMSHLMESPQLVSPTSTYKGPAKPDVEKVSYAGGTVWLDKKQTHGFRGVPEEVWNFHIGGYQVCEKWLKDRQAKGGKNPRPGRVLTDEDIAHYQKIVVALSDTIRIMAEIDEVIEAHGGWPDAFVAEKKAE